MSGQASNPRLTRIAKTIRGVPGRPVRQMPTVANTANSSESNAPANASPTRLNATGEGRPNRRCSRIAVASTPTEKTAMRLVQRAKNDWPSGGGGLMRIDALQRIATRFEDSRESDEMEGQPQNALSIRRRGAVPDQGYSRDFSQSSPAFSRRKSTRSCSRDNRLCQNSISNGVTRKPDQCGGRGTFPI